MLHHKDTNKNKKCGSKLKDIETNRKKLIEKNMGINWKDIGN